MELRECYGYLVSRDGRVFLPEKTVITRNQTTSFERTYPFRELAGSVESRGYRYVHAPPLPRKWVARLVAEAWVPNPEGKPQVNHVNGVKLDNRVENLEWVTLSENQKHAYKAGLKVPKVGEEHQYSKYTDATVRQVYILAKNKTYSQEKIGEMFGMPQITVSNILTKRTWSHLTNKIDEETH